ncbi:MAG: putative lipoate-protein ligase [Chlamydiia bacterium]|nr:putative lipoate-protein ligase [Chlamydiia bacterium]
MKLNFLELKNTPIFEQLAIEEALLRADDNNWCIINRGSTPAIVMGISGCADELINKERLAKIPLPVIRRFSGGGTVVIDEETLFVTFIFQKEDVDLGQCPRKIMQWTELLYQPVFQPEDFKLIETDYVIGERKIGGNAQYMTKSRWLHHTSFLWDYKLEFMQLLQMPFRVPEYRKSREHTAFIDCLKNYYPSIDFLKDKLIHTLRLRFDLLPSSESRITQIMQKPHRKALQKELVL